MYESAGAQREVIRRIQRDRSIQAVLVTFPYWSMKIDGLPNQIRSPLVWECIRQNFHPAFSEDGVTFWRRNPESPSVVTPVPSLRQGFVSSGLAAHVQ